LTSLSQWENAAKREGEYKPQNSLVFVNSWTRRIRGNNEGQTANYTRLNVGSDKDWF
jgi:hypothetical protein